MAPDSVISTLRLVACMTLSIRTRRTISVSASVLRLARGTPLSLSLPPSRSANQHINRSAITAFSRCVIFTRSINSRRNTRFGPCLPKILTVKMTTSSSQEGLSDIVSSGNDNNNDDVDIGSISNWKKRIDVSIAKSRKTRGSNYVQISTINYETMEPRCRTVVFRGFLKGVPFGAVREVLGSGVESVAGTRQEAGGGEGSYDCVMKMITDVRSKKVQELEMFHKLKNGGENANTVEMVWWFPKTSEQYRICGRLQFIGNDGPLYSYTDAKDTEQYNNYFVAERKQQWGNLSDMAREQFYWENPGIPFSSTWADGEGVPPGGRNDDGKVLPPPDAFLMMLMYPAKIDYLRLGDNYRQSDEWDCGDGDSGCQWKSMRVNP